MKDLLTKAEAAELLRISVGHAYKVIHRLNEELAAKGYLTFSGKVPRKYLEERCYGLNTEVKAG